MKKKIDYRGIKIEQLVNIAGKQTDEYMFL